MVVIVSLNCLLYYIHSNDQCACFPLLALPSRSFQGLETTVSWRIWIQSWKKITRSFYYCCDCMEWDIISDICLEWHWKIGLVLSCFHLLCRISKFNYNKIVFWVMSYILLKNKDINGKNLSLLSSYSELVNMYIETFPRSFP